MKIPLCVCTRVRMYPELGHCRVVLPTSGHSFSFCQFVGHTNLENSEVKINAFAMFLGTRSPSECILLSQRCCSHKGSKPESPFDGTSGFTTAPVEGWWLLGDGP